MSQRENNSAIAVLTLILIGFLFFIFGKNLAGLPVLPFAVLTTLFIFFIAFTQIQLALTALIFAMLLSPEFSLGALSAQRSIVLRVDDLLIVIFAFVWLARTTIIRGQHLLAPTPINKYILFYCIAFIFPTLKAMIIGNAKVLGATFYILKYIEYFVVFYLAAGLVKDKAQVKGFLKAFIITFAIVNIYAFLQIGTEGRVSAPFEGEGEPNTLGGYQVLMLGIILGILTHARLGAWRWPLGAVALFSLIPFAYTLSRSSYMAIGPMYLTLIFFNKFKGRSILLAALIVATIFLILFFPQNIKSRISETFVPEEQENIPPIKIAGIYLDPSASARINDWIRLFGYWKKKPFSGYGVTGVGFLDSQYIRVLVETGLIGMTAFMLLMGSIFRQTLRIYKNTKDDLYKGLALGFLAGHIGMIFHAVTANTFILIRIMEPYWFLAAIVMMIPKLEKQELQSKTPTETMEYPRNTDFLLGYGRTQ